MNPKLLKLIAILELASGTIAKVAGAGDVGAGAAIADDLLKMIQGAIAAYEAETGQPIDLGLLYPAPLFIPIPPEAELADPLPPVVGDEVEKPEDGSSSAGAPSSSASTATPAAPQTPTPPE